SATANEHTAMTMALRTPTFENCCGPSAAGTRTAAISSSGASAERFTPVKNSPIGMSLVPRTEAASTTVSQASSGGGGAPAGGGGAGVPPPPPRGGGCGGGAAGGGSAGPGGGPPGGPATAPPRGRAPGGG